jgi:hypothetical protein
LIGLLIALYPAHWRRRYGDEFRAVLEERPLGPFDVADVIIGALDARLVRSGVTDRGVAVGGHRMLLRLGGFGAIFGGILWVVGFWTASGIGDTGDARVAMSVLLLGTVGLLLALVGLSAFQGHRDPQLAWPAFLVPGLGTLASIVGIVGMGSSDGDVEFLGGLTAWSVWMIGFLASVVGSILFAIATIRAAVLSRRAGYALAITATTVLLVGFGVMADSTPPLVSWLVPAGVVAFGASWVALGLSALRGGPIRAIEPG